MLMNYECCACAITYLLVTKMIIHPYLFYLFIPIFQLRFFFSKIFFIDGQGRRDFKLDNSDKNIEVIDLPRAILNPIITVDVSNFKAMKKFVTHIAIF